ncbi:MAG: TetR/AcrR family transcriptional regulator [Chloroflexi bacterium]|nr:TetR/AcrR family transcriptional regulator [Chloroflexota bacterium]
MLEAPQPPRKGRPRDPGTDAAIRSATMSVLSERGYQGLSITVVAGRAGVSRPSVYRRYPSKVDLVVAALHGLAPGPVGPLPERTREAVGVLLAGAAVALGSPGALIILGSLLAEGSREPELADAVRSSVFGPHRATVHALLREGMSRGEVADDLDVEVADALLFGALIARAMLGGETDDQWVPRVMDVAWRALEAP